MAAKRRIALIDDAHLMNAESANALLKTLEEPPSFATLFLLAPQAESLLPTIRSRCQAVRFSPLSDETAADLLLEKKLVESRDEAEAVAALCEGSLTLARQLIDPEIRRLREALFNGLSGSRDRPLELAKAMLEGLDELGGDTPQKRRNAGWLLRFAIEFYRRAMRQLTDPAGNSPIPQVMAFAKRFQPGVCEDLENVMASIELCAKAEAQIMRNAPVPMVLECLFDDLSRTLRPRMRTG
jgi:DNA polymerase-3 subunit delta'